MESNPSDSISRRGMESFTYMFKLPKNDDTYVWTNHAKDKMVYYRISESMVKRVVRFPRRVEEGVAPQTMAAMQSRTIQSRSVRSKGKKVEEIWVMYQEVGPKSGSSRLETLLRRPKLRIISAWRYPGESPVGAKIPIPDEVLQDLENALNEEI